MILKPEYIVNSDLEKILENLKKYNSKMTPGFWSLKPSQDLLGDKTISLNIDDIFTSPRTEDREGIAWIRNNLSKILKHLEDFSLLKK